MIPLYFGPKETIFNPSKDILDYYENKAYCIQPKIDGAWCQIEILESGKVQFVSRSGKLHSKGNALDLPNFKWTNELYGSILLGELEAHRTWSIERTQKRGYNIVQLFDIKKIAGRELNNIPYSERFSTLKGLLNKLPDNNRFQIIESVEIELYKFYISLMNDKFEGAVLKNTRVTFLDQVDNTGHTKSQIKLLPK